MPHMAMDSGNQLVRFSVDQYHRMLETGILEEGTPVELLHGRLVVKDRGSAVDRSVTIGPRHNSVVARFGRLSAQLAERGCFMQIQGPITAPPDHEPEPDGSIVRGRAEDYAVRHPTPADVSCVIEVADSSLQRDRTDKQQIYAVCGIPQYVIVNLVHEVVEVYTDPRPDAQTYGSQATYERGDRVPLLAPDGSVVELIASEWLG